ncbi:MAG: hypothetical protein GEV03_03670 [Streptosporangiales bacterium]|nr:hypothetical protein [Streptosporangiales bacterium]
MSGAFKRFVLPAAIFQIVVVGPGFSTGREVVEYAGQLGALGIWTIVVLLVGFAVLCTIAYELARILRVYNYREYVRKLKGPLWPLFDLIWIVFMIVVTGIVTSAVGEVLSGSFHVPYLLAVIGVLVAIGIVLFSGRSILEGFDLLGSILFSVGIIVLAIFVLVRRWDEAAGVIASGDVSQSPSPTVAAALVSGLVYVGYNIPSVVPVLFCLDRQQKRRETITAGILSGVFVTIPFVLTYLAVQSFYDEGVTEAPIPWLVMLERTGGIGLSLLFAVVLVYAVVDTSAAMIRAFLDRVDSALAGLGRRGLTPRARTVWIVGVLVLAFVLSRIGIIALVSQGYTYLAYAFLIVFVLPLVTRGVYLILTARPQSSEEPDEAASRGG